MNANAIMVLAYRDLLKFARDPARMVGTLIFPVIFVGILGGSLQANLGADAGYNFLTFTFTGILAQTLWQSTAIGVVSLIEDRENDFTQEIFVSPISRYAIVFGKILGETLVALPQRLIVVLFGLLVGVPFTVTNLLALLAVAVIICLFGGAFGVAGVGELAEPARGEPAVSVHYLSAVFSGRGVFADQGTTMISRHSVAYCAAALRRGLDARRVLRRPARLQRRGAGSTRI